MPNPLTDTERRAAEVLRDGGTQNDAADLLGKTPTSIRRLLKREDFAALATPPEPSPTAPVRTGTATDTEEEEILSRAMRGVYPGGVNKGQPTRDAARAAIALANLRAARAEQATSTHTVERVLLTGDEDTDREVRQILDAMGPTEGGWVVLAERDVAPESEGFTITRLTDHPWKPYEADSVPVPADPPPAG